ncbi:hypothetical protein PG985_011871 [Apiospora marii]|uniref:uncharacterized protein n=1 Tax=Apiospora marii TaxID=335849 RepID=UPI00312FA193
MQPQGRILQRLASLPVTASFLLHSNSPGGRDVSGHWFGLLSGFTDDYATVGELRGTVREKLQSVAPPDAGQNAANAAALLLLDIFQDMTGGLGPNAKMIRRKHNLNYLSSAPLREAYSIPSVLVSRATRRRDQTLPNLVVTYGVTKQLRMPAL